jgi:SAM-dependent methyltransferase
MSANLRGRVPWWARIAAKITLARLPVPYRWWKRLRLFEHGDMDRPAVVLSTVLEHARTAGLIDESAPVPRFVERTDFAMLEIGPGDSLASGVAAHALGAQRSILVDAGDFATREPSHYRAIGAHLAAHGYRVPAVEVTDSATALLDACKILYLTRGVESLEMLPAASIDFCFSNAVLEHIPKAEFERLAIALLRLLRPDGVCVHRVDFKDHLGGGLNNLRFSEKTWEGSLFASSGFYTNRIRPQAMRAMFEAAGFSCEVTRIERWPEVPIDRRSMAEPFRHLPDEELRVSGMDFRLRHALP